VVICKRGNDKYTMLMAYRSILLLGCMRKVVEKWSLSCCKERLKEEGYVAMDNSEAGKGSQPLMQQPSSSRELMQPGRTAT